MVLKGLQKHCGKTDDWPIMSHPQYVLNGSFVCYQDISVYVGLSNIERWFHDEPAFKSITKLKYKLQSHIELQQDISKRLFCLLSLK